MRKSFRNMFAFVLVVITLAGFVVWLSLRGPADPVYEGKQLSIWLHNYDWVSGGPTVVITPDFSGQQKADEAVRHLGTNAIPKLLSLLRARDSSLKVRLLTLAQKQHLIHVNFLPAETLHMEAERGFRVLGGRARTAIPELIKIYDQNISPSSQKCISSLFFMFGQDAKAAVPSLVRGLDSTNEFVRSGAISALGHIRSDPETVVPALIRTLHDPYGPNRQDAAYALGAYGTNAAQAVTHLIELSHDSKLSKNSSRLYSNVQAAVKFALEHIDPDAVAKAGLQ